MKDPEATTQIPNHAADVTEKKALARGCGREKLSAVGQHHAHVLFTAFEDSVNERRQCHPT